MADTRKTREKTAEAVDAETPEPPAESDDAELDAPAEIEEADGPPLLPDPKGKATGSAIVPRDALQRYMAEVSRHPLLTREQENELAWRYFKDPEHNVDAAYKLVTANLRLVVKIAHQYRRA